MSPIFVPDITSFVFLPVLFQIHGIGSSREQVPIDIDAREFMAGYADDLRHGRRQSIVDRYDRRGAYRVGEGEKTLESWELIRAAYLTQWSPPSSFVWRDLSYEPLGDAVIVIGLFDWGLADGRKLSFSYTGLLVRQDGELRIRLEDESMNPRTLAKLNSLTG
ncbi:MAG TPA: hypothetical protein VKO87_08875 [Gemmatimonadaceae bacterium]|jgi:hypothetical protein|nr:hypothetical protein [Gemmatimonadaceae bacterium]